MVENKYSSKSLELPFSFINVRKIFAATGAETWKQCNFSSVTTAVLRFYLQMIWRIVLLSLIPHFNGTIFFAFLAHCVKLLVLILLLGSKQHAFNMTFNIYAFWFTDTQNVHPKERRCANVYHTKCLRDQSKIYCLRRKPKTTAHLKIHRHIIIFAFL